MPDAFLAFERLVVKDLLEIAQFACAPAKIYVAVILHCYPRRVIPSVLKVAKPFIDDTRGVARTDVAYDSAHWSIFPPSRLISK
jgi:hypothetical protein